MLFHGLASEPKFRVPLGRMLLLDFHEPAPSYKKLAKPVPVPIWIPLLIAVAAKVVALDKINTLSPLWITVLLIIVC